MTNWFCKISLARKFIIVSLSIALLLLVILYHLISSHFTNFYIQSEKFHFESHMKALMTKKLHYDQFNSKWNATMDFSGIRNELENYKEVLELIIYSADGTRLYSSRKPVHLEEKTVICEGLQASTKGNAFYKTRRLDQEHHLNYLRDKTSVDYVQEFYLPYSVDGDLKGIIVIFKNMDRIFSVLGQTQQDATLYAIIAFLVYALTVGFITLKIQQRERTLNSKVEQFQKLSILGQFSTKLAHELGTPIHVIQGNVEMVEEMIDNNQALDRLNVVNRQTGKMQIIVKNFLYASKTPMPEYQQIDLPLFMTEMKDLMQQFVVPDEITFTVNTLNISLFCDHNFLAQVLHNYIKNAADSIGEGKKGTIHIQPTVVDDQLEITVTDSGKGISKQDIEHIFEPFFTTKKTGRGTGLGLVVCKELIESLGGNVFYREEKDLTVFGFRIPVIDKN